MKNVLQIIPNETFNELNVRATYFMNGEQAVKFEDNYQGSQLVIGSDKKGDMIKGALAYVLNTERSHSMEGNATTRTLIYYWMKNTGWKVKVSITDNGIHLSPRNTTNVVEVVTDQLEDLSDEENYTDTVDISHFTYSQRTALYAKTKSQGFRIRIDGNLVRVRNPSHSHEAPSENTVTPEYDVKNLIHTWINSNVKTVHGTTEVIPAELVELATSPTVIPNAIYAHHYPLVYSRKTHTVKFMSYRLHCFDGGAAVTKWTPAHGSRLLFAQPDVTLKLLRDPRPSITKLTFDSECQKHGIDMSLLIER